jgi:CelD/BcsL family acetyltransferase involved in cellulose biosynthesis
VNKKHDIVAITLRDPREVSLPNVGFIELEDAETGEVFLLDTSDPSIRENFSQRASRKQEELEKLFKSMSVDHVAISTDRPYVDPLIRFFRMRAKRFH